jgi:hypothetical protein
MRVSWFHSVTLCNSRYGQSLCCPLWYIPNPWMDFHGVWYWHWVHSDLCVKLYLHSIYVFVAATVPLLKYFLSFYGNFMNTNNNPVEISAENIKRFPVFMSLSQRLVYSSSTFLQHDSKYPPGYIALYSAYEYTSLTHGAEPFFRSCQLCSFFIASGVGLSPLYCGHFWPIVPAPEDRWG